MKKRVPYYHLWTNTSTPLMLWEFSFTWDLGKPKKRPMWIWPSWQSPKLEIKNCHSFLYILIRTRIQLEFGEWEGMGKSNQESPSLTSRNSLLFELQVVCKLISTFIGRNLFYSLNKKDFYNRISLSKLYGQMEH